MSRFTFASGNAKKLASLPWYGLGVLAALVVPRSRNRWVFGCGSGVGEGALRLYRYVRTADPSLRLTWLARDATDLATAASLGIPAIPKSGMRGLWATLRAQVVVVTHGFGDANRFGVHGAFLVQLWHGIPLKLIHLDSPATLRSRFLPHSALLRRLLRRMYRHASSTISLMPAASPVAAGRLRSAFGLPSERVVVTGDPRDDVLNEGTAAQRVAQARALLAGALPAWEEEFSGSRLLLYAPTWRDGEADPGVPTAREWQLLAEYLQSSGSVLLVRPHPLGVGEYLAGTTVSRRIRLLTPRQLADVTPVLPAIDVLITDYSSIAFDYALTGGMMAFLAPDQVQYSSSRGLYQPYRDFSGGTDVASWAELVDLLERSDQEPGLASRLRGRSAGLRDENHTFRDGRNTERVYSEIITRLKGSV